MLDDELRIEKTILVENKLAEELLRSPEEERAGKYTEVYEEMYSLFSDDHRRKMSNNYRSGAAGTASVMST